MIDTRTLVAEITASLDNSKALDIQTLDVRKLTDLVDYMIICSGTSDRHNRALAQHLAKDLREKDTPYSSMEGDDSGEWVLIDYFDVIVHIMKPETRQHYDLERLWDARLENRANADIAA